MTAKSQAKPQTLIPMVTLNLKYYLDEVTIHKSTKKFVSGNL